MRYKALSTNRVPQQLPEGSDAPAAGVAARLSRKTQERGLSPKDMAILCHTFGQKSCNILNWPLHGPIFGTNYNKLTFSHVSWGSKMNGLKTKHDQQKVGPRMPSPSPVYPAPRSQELCLQGALGRYSRYKYWLVVWQVWNICFIFSHIYRYILGIIIPTD